MEAEDRVSILLVDDRPENLQAMEALLAGPGLRVVKARSGREALRRVLHEDFAVILLDVHMPDMDGFEAAAMIRGRDRSRHIPIVFVTATGATETHVSRGYSLGAVDYIFKPVVPDVLRTKVAVFVELHRKTQELARSEVSLLDANELLERRVAQRTQEIAQVNRLYSVLSQVNEAILRIRDRRELLDDVCRIAVEDGGFRLAWVGGVDKDTGNIDVLAHRGLGGDHLDAISALAKQYLEALGPAGAVSAGGDSSRTDDPAPAELAPSSQELIATGSDRRSASSALWLGTKPVGVFGVYTVDGHLLNDEEILLLERLAADVSYALEAMEKEEQRRRALVDAQRRLEQVQALRQIERAITASLDLHLTLDVFLEQAATQLRVDAASILLLNPDTTTLECAALRKFRTDALQRMRVRVGEGPTGRAALDRRTVSIADVTGTAASMEAGETEATRERHTVLVQEGFVVHHAVPLITKGQVRGVLEVFHRTSFEPDQEWLAFLEALAGQAAIAIDNAALLDGLQRSNVQLTLAYDTTLEGWSRALELRDWETEGHTQRATEMTVGLARAMGMSDAELVQVRRGALLHDIGKMGVPDAILLKPGRLSDEEWEVMRRHPVQALELLAPITYLRPALDIPYCHHEKWDGSGYPRGLRGETIPLAARVFAVADVWDAMRSDRPYRAALPEQEVREHIRAGAGTHFDPQVTKVFLENGHGW